MNSRGNKLDFSDRPYLEEIYRDQHPNIVYIKAAQCFPPETRIYVDGGQKDIKDIKPGEMVYGSDGMLHKVIATSKRKYHGELTGFKTRPGDQIYSTPDHPFYSYKYTFSERKHQRYSDTEMHNSIFADGDFYDASELKKGDFLVRPIIKNSIYKTTFDLSEFRIENRNKNKFSGEFVYSNKNDYTKRSIKLDEDLALLLGFYCSEGYSRKDGNRINFAFHKNEQQYVNKIKKILSKYTKSKVRQYNREKENAIVISISNSFLKVFLNKSCGDYSHDKKIPSFIFSSTDSIKKSFISGCYKGDGGFSNNQSTLTSTSKEFILQMQVLLSSIGIFSVFRLHNRKNQYGQSRESYRLVTSSFNTVKINEITQKIGVKNSVARNTGVVTHNNLMCSRISVTSKKEYSGYVYNLEVEDTNDYIANGYLVHNCGLSERVLSETVWVAEQLGKIVLYTFPASSQLQDFTQARLDPVFQHSDYLAEVYRKSSTGVQKIELKKVGDGYIYFRGSQNEKQIISIDADMIVLDERDRFTNTAIPYIDKRTLASDLRWRRELSTPTVPGFGIDEAYKNSDQRVWQLQCKKCGLWQEIDFFKNIDHKTYRVHCSNDECNSTMDRLAKGKWQPLKPELSDEVHGYRISGIFNPRRTVKEIVDDYYKSMNGSIADLEQFYNQTLGMPFQMDGMKLNKDDLDRCKRDYRMPYDVKPAYAGCDVGSVHNITVSIPTGKDKDGNQKMKLIWAGKVNNFFGPSDSIEYIMKKYDIKLLVIDKNPETSSVMKLIEMFPGRVFAATYPSKNFTIDNYIMWDDIIKEVKVDRTISLDYLVGDIQNERIELPENISFIDDFYEQMCSAVRVSVKNNKTGEVTARWVEEKSDHFFHTLNYNRLAILKGGVGQALVDYYKQPEEGNFNSVSQMVQWVKINGKRIF